MTALIDLTGRRCGMLVVLERGPNRGRHTRWWCQCDCGVQSLPFSADLVSGHSTSCGCVTRIKTTKHGHYKSRTYRSWQHMCQRVMNKKNNKYHLYGGRGIEVHTSWLTFENFIRDIGIRPENTSLDRINTNGNYEPGNCRWATIAVQNRNTRRVRWLTYKDESLSLGDWATRLGMTYQCLQRRLSKWDNQDKIFTPL